MLWLKSFCRFLCDVTDVWPEMWWLRRMVEYSDHNDRFRTCSGTIWPLRHDTTSCSSSQVLADAARCCHYNVTSVGKIKFELIVFRSDVLAPHLQGLSGCCIFRNEAAQERWRAHPHPPNCFHHIGKKCMIYKKSWISLPVYLYLSPSGLQGESMQSSYLLNCSFSPMKHCL